MGTEPGVAMWGFSVAVEVRRTCQVRRTLLGGRGVFLDAGFVGEVDAGEDDEAAGDLFEAEGFGDEGDGDEGGDDGLAEEGDGDEGGGEVAEGVVDGEVADDLGEEAHAEEGEVSVEGEAAEGEVEGEAGQEEDEAAADGADPEAGEGAEGAAVVLGVEDVGGVEGAGEDGQAIARTPRCTSASKSWPTMTAPPRTARRRPSQKMRGGAFSRGACTEATQRQAGRRGGWELAARFGGRIRSRCRGRRRTRRRREGRGGGADRAGGGGRRHTQRNGRPRLCDGDAA